MQYLTRPDGSIPPNVDVAALVAAGIKIVRPTPRPTPVFGFSLIEGEPVERDGVLWQNWVEIPIVVPEPIPPEVPEEVALWQFRAALKLTNNFDRVQYGLAQLSSPEVIIAAELFEYGNKISRHCELVQAVAALTNASQEELDALFIRAASVKS